MRRRKRGIAHAEPRRVDLRPSPRTPIGSVPGVEERAARRLARAIHAAESTHCATSWSAQERAQDFYNTRGMAATLDEAARLEALRLPDASN